MPIQAQAMQRVCKYTGDAMMYLTIQDRSIEALRMKWQDARMAKLENYSANVNTQYKVKMPECRMSLGS